MEMCFKRPPRLKTLEDKLKHRTNKAPSILSVEMCFTISSTFFNLFEVIELVSSKSCEIVEKDVQSSETSFLFSIKSFSIEEILFNFALVSGFK